MQGCIYVITNQINYKQYVGLTCKPVEVRLKEHFDTANRKDYPLSKAIRKYGKDNFIIEIIEDNIEVQELPTREIYWIDKLDTFNNGYNATKGGDGTPSINREKIKQLWDEGYGAGEIHKITGHKSHNISMILQHDFGIPYEEIRIRKNKQIGKAISKLVYMLDKDTKEILRYFPSQAEASKFLGVPNKGHISDVCKGKRKSHCGYSWRYVNV